ncbi:MAG: dkgA, partial [Mycobacterium sp.]|nr:dkgA [Mycobacterium sp.]
MATAEIPNTSLNDDNTIPVLGIGTGELSEAEAEHAVSAALEIGVRLIDTAAAYGNEAAVGRAIAASGIPRAEIFVTTKLATEDQGYQASQDALKASLERLGMEYVDLYLIHWPAGNPSKYIDSFGGLMKQKELGNSKSVGVANFTPDDLTTIMDLAFFVPAVNQVELHPLLNQSALRSFHAEHNILTQAYGPLGVGKLLDNPAVTSVADAYGKTPAQVLIRWNVQLGNSVV